MNAFFWTIFWNVIIAFGIIIVIQVVKIFKKKISLYLDYLTALTVWLLLAIVGLGFFPKIMESGAVSWEKAGIFILLGLLLFYVLELFFHWHHCKEIGQEKQSCCHTHKKEHENNFLMFAGTLMHNGFHGFVLFSAFSVDFSFGIATTIAILLHAIPQNVANYIMNHENAKYAYIAGVAWIFWALLTYPFIDFLVVNKILILCIISWGLLYTALADILPNVKNGSEVKQKAVYLLFMLFWVLAFIFFENVTGAHDHEHWVEDTHEIHTEIEDIH